MRPFYCDQICAFKRIHVVLIILLEAGAIIFGVLPPLRKPIDLENPYIRESHVEHEMFPSWSLTIFAFIQPITIIFLNECLRACLKKEEPPPMMNESSNETDVEMASLLQTKPRTVLQIWRMSWLERMEFEPIIGILFALSATLCITHFLKFFIASPRPDFLARCAWNGTSCTGQPALVDEGRRSFPSGHSSLTFCALTFQAAYWSHRMRRRSERLSVDGKPSALVNACSLFFIVVCESFAAFVAYSRILDHRHHPVDVVFGSMIGITLALIAYLICIRTVRLATFSGDTLVVDLAGTQVIIDHPMKQENASSPQNSLSVDQEYLLQQNSLFSVNDEMLSESSKLDEDWIAPHNDINADELAVEWVIDDPIVAVPSLDKEAL